MIKNIPFKKEIDFNKSFTNITSINLEHDYKIYDDMISGSFKLFGTLRKSEASLVDEDFSYDIPFDIALSDDIDLDTVSLNITDFDYNIISNNKININIDLELNYEEKENDRNISLDSILDSIDFEDEKEETNITIQDDDTNNTIVDESNINVISSFIKDKKDYVTYNIYIAKDFDNINTISNKFNVPINVLEEYNGNDDIKVGDKIIIPYIYE